MVHDITVVEEDEVDSGKLLESRECKRDLELEFQFGKKVSESDYLAILVLCVL